GGRSAAVLVEAGVPALRHGPAGLCDRVARARPLRPRPDHAECPSPPAPRRPQRSRLRTSHASHATIPEAGMGSTQATTMLPATPQRTAENRSLAPTPMIADEITWGVETGIPSGDAPMMIVAAVFSAAKPCTGSSLTTRWPIVLMIRQPPAAVPSEIALAARKM